MDRKEALEWSAMLLVIVAWWPILLAGWGPPWYRHAVEVYSVLALGFIFWRRLRRVNEGLAESERMMQQKIEAERAARGGDPSLDDLPGPTKKAR